MPLAIDLNDDSEHRIVLHSTSSSWDEDDSKAIPLYITTCACGREFSGDDEEEVVSQFNSHKK